MLWPTPRNFVRSLRCSFDAVLWGQKQTFRLVTPFIAPFLGGGHTRGDDAPAAVDRDRDLVGPADADAGAAGAGDPLVAEITVPAAVAPVRPVAVPEPPAVADPLPVDEPVMAGDVRAAAGRVDDLTVIDGIGPKLAERLKTAGVSTFAALAAWRPGDVERFEATLPPVQRGRLEREDWIGQARVLAAAG